MSKRSKLALILAMLLGASTVISACNDGGRYSSSESSSSSSSDSSSSESSITPEEEEELANELYKERIDKWLQYVEYNGQSNTLKTVSTRELTEEDTNEKKTALEISSQKTYKTKETGDYKATFEVPNPNYDPANPTPGMSATIDEKKTVGAYEKTSFYVKETGKFIDTFTQKTYLQTWDAEKGGYVLLHPDRTQDEVVLFEFDESRYANLLEVKKTEYILKAMVMDPSLAAPITPNPDENPDADTPDTNTPDTNTDETENAVETYVSLIENYDEVVTYSYYDVTTGNKIAEGLEKRAVARGDVVDIDDKTYVMGEDGIAKVFDLGMDYTLPKFAKDNQQYVADNYDPYVYFEQGEYGYRIDEEEAIAVQISADFAMATFPGVSVSVYKDYNLVATYETNVYHVSGYAVLPNGNVYFCEYRQLPEDATEYDIALDVYKFDVVHTILDVTTGQTSEVENGFVASKIYTESTPNIQTLLHLNTLGQDNILHSMKLKEGYVLAEIQAFEDGALTGNSTFAVLNSETMELVEELPKIVDTQFGYASFVSKNYMLLMMKPVDNQSLFYTVNVATGDLELFSKNAFSRIKPLEKDCFLYDDKIYDYNFELVADLEDYASVKVLKNGKLLLKKENRWNENLYMDVSWYVGTITESYDSYHSNGGRYVKSLSTTQIFYDTASRVSEYDNWIGLMSVTYNEDGNFFTTVSDGKESIYALDIQYNNISTKLLLEEKEEWDEIWQRPYGNRYASYRVTTKIESVEKLVDGQYVVKVSEHWVFNRTYGYDYNEVPAEYVFANSGKTYYTYYIIK